MLKILPLYYCTPQKKHKQNCVSFSSNQLYLKPLSPQEFPQISTQTNELPWISDEIFVKSINHLKYLKFDDKDVEYIKSMNVILPFDTGQEAVDFMKKSHIGIKFNKLPSENIHAQYDSETNCIDVNEIYKGTKNPAEILAISEAILHECGHAKDEDGVSSIQEEIDCLSMNVLSHRIFNKKFPNIFSNVNSPIIDNGVNLYADLFFDKDMLKTGLIQRLKYKYGNLPAGDFKHPPSNLALDVKSSQN